MIPDIATLIATWREEAGLTVSDLAEGANVTPQAVRNAEAGRAKPSYDGLDGILRTVAGVGLAELLHRHVRVLKGRKRAK